MYKFFLQPLIEAITRLAESRGAPPDIANHPRLRELEQNLAVLEQSMKNVLEEQAFQHELLRASSAQGAQFDGTIDGTVTCAVIGEKVDVVFSNQVTDGLLQGDDHMWFGLLFSPGSSPY